jgi:cysteine-rich repeat protein
MDVTDVFNEVLVSAPGQPTTPVGILFEGNVEPLTFIPQTFFINVLGDGVQNTLVNAGLGPTQGGVTLVVPRRNNGPIVQTTFNASSPTPLTGLSVAYTGWSATHEVETLRRFARASSMADFKAALQYFDVGSQNWSYADVNGNIAYYTSGELPLRQDLQTLFFPAGLVHPGIIRDGTNTNKHQWLPQGATPTEPNQALSTRILPFSEMPQVENPPSGYVLNANNDPVGTTLDNVSWNQFRAGNNGLLYLSAGYASGERQGRIQRLFANILAGAGTLSVSEAMAVQANNQILDAEILAPYLLQAYANATAPGAPPELQAIVADPRIGDAIARLSAWDFSTPTGIQQGFDPGDNPLALPVPSAGEVSASVAATIYSTWRGQVIKRVIDQTLATLPVSLVNFTPGSDQAMSALRRFLDTYDTTGGVGASLINFFRVPGVVDQFVARDIILLESLRNGLNLLASNDFAPAFANSTNLDDYRWGKLHRIVFSHFLGGPFNMPPAGHPLNVAPNLPGIARPGGRQSVDAAAHDARADGLNEFMFNSGPARRVIATMTPGCPQVMEVIPGGESGLPGNPNATDQLFLWLVNAYKPLPVCLNEVIALATQTVEIACGNGVVDPGEACDDGNTDDGDGCNNACQVAPVVTCLDPSVSGDPATCTADIACSAIATCTDASGNVTAVCVPESPYGAGETEVAVTCANASATCTATVTVICDDGDACTSDGCGEGTGCVFTPIAAEEPNPRTNGYWKRLCQGPHSGDELVEADADCVAAMGETFADVTSVADLCAVLRQGGQGGTCGHAEIDLMSLALNQCHVRVCGGNPIDSQYTDNVLVSQSYAEADAILSDPDRSHQSCLEAQHLLEEINNGRALHLETTVLAKVAGGVVRLTWQVPYSMDPIRYNVWRRPAGSLAPFVKIGETTTPVFDDATPGSFQYDVSPVR